MATGANSSPVAAGIDLLIWVVIGAFMGTLVIGVGGQLLSVLVIPLWGIIPGNELFGWGASIGGGAGAATWVALALRRRYLMGGK